MDVEKIVTEWIERNTGKLSRRAKRFLAMYFPDARIRRKFWIETGVMLGENTYLNLNVTVADDYMSGEILLEIGSNCSVAPGVVFAPVSHHNNSKVMRREGLLTSLEKREKIVVGDDVWIGANCTILPGVTIGRCSVIGANSMVNKNIPEYSLAYGNPVRIIKDLRTEMK